MKHGSIKCSSNLVVVVMVVIVVVSSSSSSSSGSDSTGVGSDGGSISSTDSLPKHM